MAQPISGTPRSVARIVVAVLCLIVVFAAGIAVLVGPVFGGPHGKEWVGAGLIAAAVGMAALLLYP